LNVLPVKGSNQKSMKYLSYLLLAVACATAACLAQSTNSESPVDNWGEPVEGVQMSIALTKLEIERGSSVKLQCQVRNLSVNPASLVITGNRRYDFGAVLVGHAGESYDLAPKDKSSKATFRNSLTGIKSGEIYRCDIPISLDSTIPAGTYQIKVTQTILAQNKINALVSNLLEVQIK
jgi:hypothetical protein